MGKIGFLTKLMMDLSLIALSLVATGNWKWAVAALTLAILFRRAFRISVYEAERVSQRVQWEQQTERLLRKNRSNYLAFIRHKRVVR